MDTSVSMRKARPPQLGMPRHAETGHLLGAERGLHPQVVRAPSWGQVPVQRDMNMPSKEISVSVRRLSDNAFLQDKHCRKGRSPCPVAVVIWAKTCRQANRFANRALAPQ